MKKNQLLTILLSVFYTAACTQEKQQKTTTIKRATPDKISTAGPLNEGKIDIEIVFPGSPLGGLIKKVDPEKGNIQQQLKELSKGLSADELEKMKKATASNPVQAMAIVFTPVVKNEMWVKGDKATGKCDGLTFHLENTVSTGTKSGKVFVESRSKTDKKISFTYDEKSLAGNQLQTRIDAENYNRKQTSEEELIAGYNSKKAIYTFTGTTPAGIRKLEVWSSDKISTAVNFLHPYYLSETSGITRIDVYFEDTPEPFMSYRFTKITPGKVTDDNLNIQESQPVYNYKTDELLIGKSLIGIFF